MDLTTPAILRPVDHRLFADAVTDMLVSRGFVERGLGLVDLHRHVPPERLALDDNYMNDLTRALYALDARFLRLYHDLIAALGDHLQGFDVLFQASPIVRIHAPERFPPALRMANGRGAQFHSDLLGGHPPGMINGWLALTDAAGGAALHLAPLDWSIAQLDAFAAGQTNGMDGQLAAFYERQRRDKAFADDIARHCTPLGMAAGDLVLFDARTIHGGAENNEDATRVSVDFRLLPLPEPAGSFEDRIAASHPRWRRGEILDTRSARDLATRIR